MNEVEITLTIIFSSLGFLIILYLLISFFMMYFISHPKKLSKEKALEVDINKGLISEDLSYLKREELNIKVRDGTIIHGDFSSNINNKKIMIFLHGYTWNRNGQIKYAQFFFKHGYSVYLYDERGHGENSTKFTTFGVKEGQDLDDIIKYFRNKYKDSLIGVHGESLGASSVLMSLKENPDIDFAIEDCGYASFKEVLLHKMKEHHIPKFFIYGINMFLKMILHYSFKDCKPYIGAKESNIPLLIIHGDNDKFIDIKHAYKIYEEGKDHSKLVVIKGADHALSYQTNPLFYESICMDFIKNNIKEG